MSIIFGSAMWVWRCFWSKLSKIVKNRSLHRPWAHCVHEIRIFERFSTFTRTITITSFSATLKILLQKYIMINGNVKKFPQTVHISRYQNDLFNASIYGMLENEQFF